MNQTDPRSLIVDLIAYQLYTDQWMLVRWILCGFPHVRDLWCESYLWIPDHLQPWFTFFPAIEIGNQCHLFGISNSRGHQSRSRPISPFRQRCYRLRLYASMRIGEASNPGPTLSTAVATFAVSNPTSIYQKASLAKDLGVDTLMLAETAATVSVQTLETTNFRRYGYDSIWGPPMQPHQHHQTDSFKGIASGTSMHSVFPIRKAFTTDTSEWPSAGRILHAFIQFPLHEFQILTLYGFPASKRNARNRTNELIKHAIQLSEMNTFPAIFCGDFNHHPDDLTALQPLWDRGYRTAEQIHFQLTGDAIPPTYRDSTRNDVAIFAPEIVHMVTKVWVDCQQLIAGHNPLCFALSLPQTTLFQQTWRLPQTWTCLDPKPCLVAKHFQVEPLHPETHPLHDWSQRVEEAVHLALQEQLQNEPTQQFAGLPKRFRGRCAPTKIKKQPYPRSIKRAWDGQYQPQIDQPTIRIKQLTRQTRRVQALRHRVLKWEQNADLPSTYACQLWEEWHCICRAPGFDHGFLEWLKCFPEVVLVPIGLPNSEDLYDLQQVLLFHTDAAISAHKTKQSQLAKFARQQDTRRYGRAQAFQSVKEQGAGMMTSLLAEKQWTVHCQLPAQYGLITVQTPETCTLEGFDNLHLDNQPVDFVQYNPPHLELALRTADQVFAATAILSQRQFTARPAEIAMVLDQHWRQYWDRDKLTDPDHGWTELQTLIDQIPQHGPLDFDFYDLQRWRTAIKNIKSKTARGVCAWSADELKALPDACVLSLIQAFQQLETTGMGRHLMAARTVPLRKKQGSSDPADTRPITILSLLYRLWGKVLTKAVLQVWQTSFPPAVTGFLPHRSAVIPMYRLQHQLEAAHQSNTKKLTGLTLDIRKCFNCLPIAPSAKLMQRLGIPKPLAAFWLHTIQDLDRHWHICNQIFATGKVSTGVPEGDAVSVMIMLAYNYIWTSQIHDLDCEANAYADNWAYATPEVATHSQVLAPMMQLIRAMRLEVDWSKTWIWVTHEELKQPLKRHLAQTLPEDVELQCVPNAKDLGFILHYRRKQLRTQKERHQKALKTLKRLNKTVHDLDTKALIIQCAFTKALYGAHTHVTSEQTLRELRAAAADVLVGPHRNVNGFLACSTLSPMLLDPELYVIQQAVRFAREFLVNTDPQVGQNFLAFAATQTHKPKTVTGPSGALAVYLARLGWQLTSDGTIMISAFFSLHICNSSWENLVDAMTHSWMEHVSLQLSSRKGYKGLPIIDAEATQKLFQKMPENTKLTLSYAITGGYMLEAQKAKFDAAASDQCHYCQQAEDTAMHRVLYCPLTAPIREKYQDACDYFDQHDPCLVTCPVVYVDPEWELHRQIWFSMPDPTLALPGFAMSSPIYTDGTCQMPEDPKHRFACFAAVCVNPGPWSSHDLLKLTAEERLSTAFHTIVVSTLPGRQTIARAELYIVVLLFEHRVQGPIVTDSQYVINCHQLILQTTDWRHLHMKPNFDLLFRWHHMIWRETVVIPLQKVTSHEPLTVDTPADLLLQQIGNDTADTAAKQAAKHLSKQQHNSLRTLHQEHVTHCARLQEQLQMRFDIALMCIQFDKPAVALHTGGDPVNFLQQMKTWWFTEEPQVFVLPTVDEAAVHASHWGTRFTDLLIQWVQSLQWSKPDTASPPLGVTWIELLFNFLLTTQYPIPVNIAPYKKPSNYVIQEDVPEHDLTAYSLSHTVMSFQRAVEHIHFLTQQRLVPDSGQVKTGSLYYLGAGTCRNGFSARPVMMKQSETLDFLWQYFADHQQDGKVVFEAVPTPPECTPVFSPIFELPTENTQKARLTRYHRYRLLIQQSKNQEGVPEP